ncbi:ABC transporter permease [Methylovirgula sp. 4M-Z18]|nr:ABC transporter permease [Methylovirgula sp. 4M-Z18]
MTMDAIQSILMIVVTASMPLIIAAIGELIVERAGVLNLGVEGMMIMGAAAGFACAYLTQSTTLGALAGIAAGMALSAVFALLVLGLATNQVATGLALTIFGLGFSGLLGAGFVGLKLGYAPHLYVPVLNDIPGIGRLLFGEDFFVYVGFAIVAAVWWFLRYSRAGLTLRAVGDSHLSAHALGLEVRKIRLLAILFGGGCAGLAGAYLSLAYTPFWTSGMSAGRGWIALALVVFASWRPWRVVVGALLFGGMDALQYQAQGFGISIPAQFLTASPYLVTIIALVMIAAWDRRGANAPADLGKTFIPGR